MDEYPSKKVQVLPWADSSKSNGSMADQPADTDILCPPYVYGYCLGLRRWCRFFVDTKRLKTVTWKEDMWKDLILAPTQKELLRSMVSKHSFASDLDIHDEEALKGKGLVVVLHGPPGTGKTLTAGKLSHTAPQIFFQLNNHFSFSGCC